MIQKQLRKFKELGNDLLDKFFPYKEDSHDMAVSTLIKAPLSRVSWKDTEQVLSLELNHGYELNPIQVKTLHKKLIDLSPLESFDFINKIGLEKLKIDDQFLVSYYPIELIVRSAKKPEEKNILTNLYKEKLRTADFRDLLFIKWQENAQEYSQLEKVSKNNDLYHKYKIHVIGLLEKDGENLFYERKSQEVRKVVKDNFNGLKLTTEQLLSTKFNITEFNEKENAFIEKSHTLRSLWNTLDEKEKSKRVDNIKEGILKLREKFKGDNSVTLVKNYKF